MSAEEVTYDSAAMREAYELLHVAEQRGDAAEARVAEWRKQSEVNGSLLAIADQRLVEVKAKNERLQRILNGLTITPIWKERAEVAEASEAELNDKVAELRAENEQRKKRYAELREAYLHQGVLLARYTTTEA